MERTLRIAQYIVDNVVGKNIFAMTELGTIKLDQFLKMMGIVGTGGQAKLLIQTGEVTVNGAIETRRGRKLAQGDIVSTMGETLQVDLTLMNDSGKWK
jgi:ribosome-associated protein